MPGRIFRPPSVRRLKRPLSGLRESEGDYNPPNRSGGLQPWVAKRLRRTYEVVRTARTIPVAHHWRKFAGQNMNESLVVALKVLCHSLWRQWDLDCLVGR